MVWTYEWHLDKMLSNNTFLETRVQGLLDGLVFVERSLGVHVQCVLKMNRFYTLDAILRFCFVKYDVKLKPYM